MWYDLGGSLGFLSTTFVSLYYPTLKARYWEGTNASFPSFSSFAPRQRLLTSALTVWAIRLGSFLVEVITSAPVCATWSVCDRIFLVQRAIRAGGDSRFDKVKHQPGIFLAFWMVQGLIMHAFFSPRVSLSRSFMGSSRGLASLSGMFSRSCGFLE